MNIRGDSKALEGLPSADMMRSILSYDPDTGRLFWLARGADLFRTTAKRSADHSAAVWNSAFSGREAFTAVDAAGYKIGSIFSRMVRAHRAAWVIYYGHWPSATIDHIDGNRANNRIANLRDVSHAENCRNVKRNTMNTSGYTGVFFDNRSSKWSAAIKVNGRLFHLGLFSSKEDAIAAREKANARFAFGPSHGAWEAKHGPDTDYLPIVAAMLPHPLTSAAARRHNREDAK